jgi:hypothetical protein
MAGIVLKIFAKMAARWHRYWLGFYTAKSNKLIAKGEPYTSPKLVRLSGCCTARGMKAVRAAKRGGFYKRGRIVRLSQAAGAEDRQSDVMEK